MSQSASEIQAVGQRYAAALYAIAEESKSVDKVEKELDGLGGLILESDDLQSFLTSPVYTREEQVNVIGALSKKAGLSASVGNTLLVMANKGRAAYVGAMIASFKSLAEAARGEVVAEVISAKPLTAAQSKKLADSLKKSAGKDVALDVKVDESLLGGLIVKLGSTMIDSSIRGKLSKLQNAMKEVG